MCPLVVWERSSSVCSGSLRPASSLCSYFLYIHSPHLLSAVLLVSLRCHLFLVPCFTLGFEDGVTVRNLDLGLSAAGLTFSFRLVCLVPLNTMLCPFSFGSHDLNLPLVPMQGILRSSLRSVSNCSAGRFVFLSQV